MSNKRQNIRTTYYKKNTNETVIVIHADNPFIDSNTLCNMDYSGDNTSELEYSSERTEEKINCDECIAQIKYAKTFSEKDFQVKRIRLNDIY